MALVERHSVDPSAWNDLRISAVDAVGLEARAAALAGRSIKKQSKLVALDLAIRCMDLTTLEGVDTPAGLHCAQRRYGQTARSTVPPSQPCGHPELVRVRREHWRRRGVDASLVHSRRIGPIEGDCARSRGGRAKATRANIVLNRVVLRGRLHASIRRGRGAKRGVEAHLKVIPRPANGQYARPRDRLGMAAGADLIRRYGKSARSDLPVALHVRSDQRYTAEGRMWDQGGGRCTHRKQCGSKGR